MGFGDTVRSDDAIGCYVIDELTAFFMTSRSVTLFDMGAFTSDILLRLKGHDHVILVDGTTDSGKAPGTVIRLPASDVERIAQEAPSLHLHSLKWDQALAYGKNLLKDEFPEKVDVYLIAIENTSIAGEISEEVKNAGDQVVRSIRRAIAETGY